MPRQVTLTDVIPRITLNVDPTASSGQGEVVRVTITYTVIDANGEVFQQGAAKFEAGDAGFTQLQNAFRTAARGVLNEMRQRAGVTGQS